MTGLFKPFEPDSHSHRRKYAEWRDPPSCCDECGGPAVLVHNRILYGKWSAAVGSWPWVYYCLCCAAAVGCHNWSIYPKGTMAGRQTAALRLELHRLFDPTWQGGSRTRREAYGWLAELLGIPPWESVHIGEMDAMACQKAIGLLRGGTHGGGLRVLTGVE